MMAHYFAWAGVAAFLGGTSACAMHGSAGPTPLPRASGESQTEATPQRNDTPPKLLAPPPAYGNKVVLAEAKSTEKRF